MISKGTFFRFWYIVQHFFVEFSMWVSVLSEFSIILRWSDINMCKVRINVAPKMELWETSVIFFLIRLWLGFASKYSCFCWHCALSFIETEMERLEEEKNGNKSEQDHTVVWSRKDTILSLFPSASQITLSWVTVFYFSR